MPAKGQPAIAPTAAATAAPREVARWMPARAAEKWQGAWTLSLVFGTRAALPRPVAVEITGDKAKVFDGSEEHAVTFAVESPCRASFVDTRDGGITTQWKQFLIAGNTITAGDGAVGYRKGTAAIVCLVDKLVTLDDSGRCTSWSGTWTPENTTCAWSNVDGKDVLTVGIEHGSGEFLNGTYVKPVRLVAEGDLLQEIHDRDVPGASSERLHGHATSYEEAAAALKK